MKWEIGQIIYARVKKSLVKHAGYWFIERGIFLESLRFFSVLRHVIGNIRKQLIILVNQGRIITTGKEIKLVTPYFIDGLEKIKGKLLFVVNVVVRAVAIGRIKATNTKENWKIGFHYVQNAMGNTIQGKIEIAAETFLFNGIKENNLVGANI